MPKTLIINLDAFKFEYLERTEYLKGLASTHRHGRLRTILGYTGIEGSILSGHAPQEHGIWVEFLCSPASSPFKFLRPLSFLEHTPLDKLVRCLATMFFVGLRWLRGYSHLTRVPQVPFKVIHHFDVSLTKDWSVPGALCVPTIFDLFRQQHKPFVYFDWPVIADNHRIGLDLFTKNNDRSKVETLFRHLDKADVFWLRLWDLDSVSHSHGTNDPETNQKIKEVDGLCRMMIERAQMHGPVNFLFWADHGMVDVTATIDIAPLVLDLDILMFLDSSMARFWVKTEKQKRELARRLENLAGKILSGQDLKKYNLEFTHNKYGDVIFLADPGVLIFPNYYQRLRPAKAMHGYSPEHPDQHGLYLSSRLGPREDRQMSDMFEEIKILTLAAGG